MKGLTLEGWCEEAIGQWKSKLGPDGEVKVERESPSLISCVLWLLLTVVLLCATAAAFVDYPLLEKVQDWWMGEAVSVGVTDVQVEAIEAPRGGLLMLVLGGITSVQLIVLILALPLTSAANPRLKGRSRKMGRKPAPQAEEQRSS
eukprot:symbB.v1.2.011069.t1/scaffold738.1/size167167/3